MPHLWRSRTSSLLAGLRRTVGCTARGLVDGHLVSLADLAADVECDPLTGRNPGSKLDQVAVVPGDGDLAEAHATAVIDDGNLRAARAKHECGRGNLHQIVGLKLECHVDVHSR